MYRSMQVCKRCVRRLNILTPKRQSSSSIPDNYVLSEEVKSALRARQPIVALETTIVTHGMPFPHNLRMATEVEGIVRENGCVPATIGIISGKVHVGLNTSQLEFLADPTTSSFKTSRRDFAYITSQKLHGGTTVSGTMLVANLAGIPLFVTGGIGGVHRGGEISLDVSADLRELSRTPVTVISSGVKSILDIGRTLEYLETEGVCVASYGKSQEFPSFFTRRSGHSAPYQLETAVDAARLVYSNELLGMQSGTLIGVPIPEQFDTLGQEIEVVIQSVIKEAQEEGVHGKEITPFILGRVNERTAGKSLEANIHLVKNNAAVGSQIAVELAKLRQNTDNREDRLQTNFSKTESFSTNSKNSVRKEAKSRKKVTVVGGSIVDFNANMMTEEFQVNGATYPGKVTQTFGGVGRNIADGLSRLGVDTCFISAVGMDSHRAPFENHCRHMDLRAVQRLEGHSTATYCAVLGQGGELMFGIGEMEIHKQITPQLVSKFAKELSESAMVCVDGNIPVNTLEYVCGQCQQNHIPVLFDPTDLDKAAKPFLTEAYKGLAYTTPNFNELKMMAAHLSGSPTSVKALIGSADDLDCEDALHQSIGLLDVVSDYIPVVLVTLGKHGVILCHHGDSRSRSFEIKKQGEVCMEFFPAVPKTRKLSPNVSVSGAGDCMVAAMVSKLLEGQSLETSVKAGLLAAQISLQSILSVPPTLSAQAINAHNVRSYMNVDGKILK